MVRICAAALLSIVVAIFGASKASAGWFICNNTGTEFDVAVGWLDNGGQLAAHGWWTIKPRDCALPLLGHMHGYYYFYATGGDLTFENNDGSNFFCADRGIKFDYVYNGHPDCHGYNFREVAVGDTEIWTTYLLEQTNDPRRAALKCQEYLGSEVDFATCWIRQVATSREREILECMQTTRTPASLGICASKGLLGEDEQRAADCTLQYATDRQPIALTECLRKGLLDEKSSAAIDCAIAKGQQGFAATASCLPGTQMSSEQRRVYDCVARNANDYQAIGICIGMHQFSQDQRRIANCVMQNNGSYVEMGVCAVGNKLTPEQRVFASCAISSGGQPYVFAACVGTQATVNELEKCLTKGIGDDGCFGKHNEAVKFVKNAWKDVTEGPGPSNDLLGRDGFAGRTLENMRNDLQHGPGPNNDAVGKNGFVCKKLLGGLCK